MSKLSWELGHSPRSVLVVLLSGGEVVTGTAAGHLEQQLKPQCQNALELTHCHCLSSLIVKGLVQAYSLFSFLFTCCSFKTFTNAACQIFFSFIAGAKDIVLRSKWKEETLFSVRHKWCSAAGFTFLLLVVVVFCKMAK